MKLSNNAFAVFDSRIDHSTLIFSYTPTENEKVSDLAVLNYSGSIKDRSSGDPVAPISGDLGLSLIHI